MFISRLACICHVCIPLLTHTLVLPYICHLFLLPAELVWSCVCHIFLSLLPAELVRSYISYICHLALSIVMHMSSFLICLTNWLSHVFILNTR